MNLQYKSFYWCLGTTSFRTKNFNKKIEQQLALLRTFWSQKENLGQVWSENNGIQTNYYNFLHTLGFISGNAKNKPKDAREKTSGLVSLGLIDNNRQLTNAGIELLNLSEQNNFAVNNSLGLPADSFLYFKQLLKTSLEIEEVIVRPFIITIYLIEKLNGISFEEFTYILPLCIDRRTTLQAVENIKSLRENKTSPEHIIISRLLCRDNYRTALKYFLKAPAITEEIVATVGINRKSRTYDKVYFPLYNALHKFYVDKDMNSIQDILISIKKLSNTDTLWQQYLFGKTNLRKIKKSPLKYLQATHFDSANTELQFRRVFFTIMHLIKTQRNLADYFDLNRRYMKTSDILFFKDDTVSLDIIPRHYFAPICDRLLDIAFESTPHLTENCPLAKIADFLTPNEPDILNGINCEFSLHLKSLRDASKLLDHQRYIRFTHMIDSQFTDEQILHILDLIASREDSEIQKLVTDNADIPTIFEYVLGILWYKISHRKGKILDYMKLSLDVDLLPKTHAAGGDADIVYEYEQSAFYPAHSLLLEATLTDRTNQRRMEMEPVSRHLGNHILRTKNIHSYCVFATSELNLNVVADFKGRKHQRYYDTIDDNNFVDGMKIIPLQIADLKIILERKLGYERLYQIFETAFQSELPPREWRNVCIVQELSNSQRKKPVQCL